MGGLLLYPHHKQQRTKGNVCVPPSKHMPGSPSQFFWHFGTRCVGAKGNRHGWLTHETINFDNPNSNRSKRRWAYSRHIGRYIQSLNIEWLQFAFKTHICTLTMEFTCGKSPSSQFIFTIIKSIWTWFVSSLFWGCTENVELIPEKT